MNQEDRKDIQEIITEQFKELAKAMLSVANFLAEANGSEGAFLGKNDFVKVYDHNPDPENFKHFAFLVPPHKFRAEGSEEKNPSESTRIRAREESAVLIFKVTKLLEKNGDVARWNLGDVEGMNPNGDIGFGVTLSLDENSIDAVKKTTAELLCLLPASWFKEYRNKNCKFEFNDSTIMDALIKKSEQEEDRNLVRELLKSLSEQRVSNSLF